MKSDNSERWRFWTISHRFFSIALLYRVFLENCADCIRIWHLICETKLKTRYWSIARWLHITKNSTKPQAVLHWDMNRFGVLEASFGFVFKQTLQDIGLLSINDDSKLISISSNSVMKSPARLTKAASLDSAWSLPAGLSDRLELKALLRKMENSHLSLRAQPWHEFSRLSLRG